MVKKLALTAGAVAALAVAFAPTADARIHHRHARAAAVAGSPVMDAQGNFYATPPGPSMVMTATGIVTVPVFTVADAVFVPANTVFSPILMTK